MAEEVIGLRIQLNGINTVIQDAETFEKVLKEANQDLIDIGINFGINTKEYQQLAKEIDTAEKTFNKIKTGAKGGRAELEEYKRGAEDFTRAFAGATAALTLFGGESESVSQAQKLASQGVAVAVAAQTIAQTELAGATIATTITLRAQTLAANTSSTALRALFTTIAANPVGALITVLGLAVTAFQLFSSGADEAAESQKEFNDSVNKEAGQTIGKLQVLTATIKNSALSIEQRKDAITELRKIAGPYYQDLSDEQILTRNLTTDIDNLKQSVLALAEARALQGRIEERATQILAAEDELVILQQNIDAAKELNKVRGVTGGGSVAGLGGGQVNEARNIQRVANAEEAYNKKLAEKNLLVQQNQKDLTRLNTTTTTYTKNLGDGTKGQDKNTDAVKKAAEAQQTLANAYKTKTEAQLKDLELLVTVSEIEGKVDADIIKRGRELLEAGKQLVKDRENFFKTSQQEFSEEIGKLLFDVIPSGADLSTLTNGFVDVFADINKAIGEGAINLVDEQGNQIQFSIQTLTDNIIKYLGTDKGALNKVKEQLSGIVDVTNFEENFKFFDREKVSEGLIKDFKELIKGLTPEQIKTLEEYYNFLSESAAKFSNKFVIAGFEIQPSTQENITKNLDTFVNRYTEILENSKLTQIGKKTEINKALQEIFTLPAKAQQDFITEVDKTGEVGFKAYTEAIQSIKNELITFAQQSKKVKDDTKAVSKEFAEIFNDIIDVRNKLGTLETNQIPGFTPLKPEDVTQYRLSVEQVGEITNLLVQKLKGAPETLTFLLDDISKQYDNYLLRFGKEGLQNLLTRLSSEYDELDNLTREQLNELLVYVDGWIAQAQLTIGEDAAQPFIQLKERIGNALKELPVEVDDEFKKTLDAIQNGVRNLQQILGQLGTLLSDSFTFELEQLENDYNTALNGVVGDTKEANDKRIELEKAYQKQKKELEKQARLTSLRITLAETIAGGAQGVVSALAIPPPAGPILAGINGAIAAAQIALVAQQLEYVSSLRRGGRLAAGGMVVGPSHENGGVRYMGGGVELEGNEAVINRNSTIQYTNLLSTINQSQGGRPILVGNAMDSRLIEVLAKQKQEPIRAYVLESDITKSQTINRKLEQLASF